MARALTTPHAAGTTARTAAGTTAPDASSTVAIVLDFLGASVPQVNRLMGRMGLEPGGPGLPGSLFQWVRETEMGVRVTQVWASHEDFEACARDRILPAAAELRLPPPETTVYKVHSHLGQGSTPGRENGEGRTETPPARQPEPANDEDQQ